MRVWKVLCTLLSAATLTVAVGCAAGVDEGAPDAARAAVDGPDGLATEAMKPPTTPTQNCCSMGSGGTCCCTAPMRCVAEEGACLCKN